VNVLPVSPPCNEMPSPIGRDGFAKAAGHPGYIA